MSKKNEPKEVIISPDGFINMLMMQNGGAVVDELDREMIKGIQAILDHGGKADLTVKFSFTKIKNLEGAMSITHDVAFKHPKEKRPEKAMFLTPGNGLSDQQQDQGSLDLEHSTPATVSHLKTVNTEEENK